MEFIVPAAAQFTVDGSFGSVRRLTRHRCTHGASAQGDLVSQVVGLFPNLLESLAMRAKDHEGAGSLRR
jgi:hypothetical protein